MSKRASVLEWEKNRQSVQIPALDAPHPIDKFTALPEDRAVLLPVDRVQPDPSQPRQTFAEESIASLAASIQEKGQLQPILVRQAGDDFIIVAGERRWRAHQQAGLPKIRAFVINRAPDEAFELSLIENLQREDLTPFEEAAGIAELMKRKHYKQKQAAQVIGRSTTQVSKLLKLNDLSPIIREKVATSQLSRDQLFQIAAQETPEQMLKLYDKITRLGLNVQETRKVAKGEEAQPQHPLVGKVSRFSAFLTRADWTELDHLEATARQELSSHLDTLAEQVREMQQCLWSKRK